MESNRHKLRVHDFKRMVRFIVTYVVLNLAGSAVIIASLHKPPGSHSAGIPMEIFLIAYFVLVSIIFVVVQKRSMYHEDIVTDARGVHTGHFGSLYFSEITAYQLFRKKRSEDLILILSDGRKIAFGPLDFRKSSDKQIYNAFKESVSKRVPKKGYKL